jgi:hypothetical protein
VRERGIHPAPEQFLTTVEAFGVDPEQNFRGLPCLLGTSVGGTPPMSQVDRATKRRTHRYPARGDQPATRRVTHTITIHRVKPLPGMIT